MPRRGSRLLAAVIALTALTAAACGTTSDRQESPTEADGGSSAETLSGSSWVLASGVGDEGEIPIVDGWPVTLSFDGDMLGGTAACNRYGGEYELDGGALRIGALSQTEMACDGGGLGDIMRSASLFLNALVSVDQLTLSGEELTLIGPSTELIFDRETPVPAAELVGQLWLLDTIIEGETASSVLGDPATLLLNEDGTLEGSTGCRAFSGEYVIAGASVQFTNFAMSGDCGPQLATQDNYVVTVLGDGFSAEIDGDRLTLTSQGNEGLGYTAIVAEPNS